MRQELSGAQGTVVEPACPRCDSPLWRDQGQVCNLIRMRQVFSNMSLQESLSGDDSDERAYRPYEQALLVNFEAEDIHQAYMCQEEAFPFGFEFIEKVQLREVNFGEGAGGLSQLEVNGTQLNGAGFILCRYCGKVQPHDVRQHETKQRHSPICRRGTRKGDEVFIESAYLYRSFQSEALRIFMPDTGMHRQGLSDVSFTAAILIGLKAFFSGNVDHLQSAPYHEPIAGEGQRSKDYLILYDTVPGGTGYLKQLASPEAFYTLCTQALEILQGCECQHRDPDPDGCYRCIYTYRHKHQLENLSRNAAIELLSAVLRHRQSMVVTRNISEIDANSLLESELERFFIETLRQAGQQGSTVQLLQAIINGKQGYTLKVNTERYEIEPQVSLGREHKVEVPSRCDFLIRHLDQPSLKIAVFTDGFQYHQSRVALDFAQRMALVKAGFIVWSLSWDDVKAQNDLQSDKPAALDFFWNPLQTRANVEGTRTGKFFLKNQPLAKAFSTDLSADLSTENAMKHLLRFLAYPQPDEWQLLMKYQCFSRVPQATLSQTSSERQAAEKAWAETLRAHFSGVLPPALEEHLAPSGDNYLSAWPDTYGVNSWVRLSRPWVVQTGPLTNADLPQSQIFVIEDMPEKKAWNGFTRLYNFFQFLPHSYFLPSLKSLPETLTTSLNTVLESPLPAAAWPLKSKSKAALPDDNTFDPAQWAVAQDMCDEEMLPLLNAMQAARWPTPEVGYEPQNAQGKILGGVAELAYPISQLAFILPDQAEDAAIYAELGWTLVIYDGSDPAVLLSSYARPKEKSE